MSQCAPMRSLPIHSRPKVDCGWLHKFDHPYYSTLEEMIRFLLAAAALVGLFSGPVPAQDAVSSQEKRAAREVEDAKASPARPNIIVILADDQGWNDIGYHNPNIQTPNLDRLAAEGVRLDQHYVYATCSPTRV